MRAAAPSHRLVQANISHAGNGWQKREAQAGSRVRSDPVFLRVFFALEAQKNISVSEASGAVAARFDPELTVSLESPQALPAYDRCLAAVLCFPVNLCLGIRFKDGEQHRMPLVVINDRLRRRAARLRAGAERFKLLDLAKIENLRARPGLMACT